MSFYVTGGSLQSDAPSYVERKADQQLLAGLLDGDFCYVLTARQMGKSSLMVRTASRLRSLGIRVAALDLTAIGGQNVTPDQWYHGLLDTLGQELDLEDELEVFWQANLHLGSLHRLMKALRQIVLGRFSTELHETPPTAEQSPSSGKPDPAPTLPVHLVIFVDEIDFVRSLPFAADEFFAAIRQCYNQRSLDPAYRRLTFCLLGVASPSDLIRDTRTTPFNIGRRIELNDFTPAEAGPLAEGLQLDGSPPRARQAVDLLGRILYWTEGHPYLTQKLCRVTAEALQTKLRAGDGAPVRGKEFVDQVCGDLFLSHRARERDDNLVFVREQLLRNETDRADLLDFYLKIRAGRRVQDDELDPLVRVLRLSGVVRVSEGWLRERNRIYKRAFDPEWVRANMPDAELRRERHAYRRGVVWALSLSGLVLAVMAWLFAMKIEESRKQQIASAREHFSQAKIQLASGRAGQRIGSLAALKLALPRYPDRADLRNQAISCLALVDLERATNLFDLPPRVSAVAVNQDLSVCAFAESTGAIKILDIDTHSITAEMPSNRGPVSWVSLSPTGEYVAAQHIHPSSPRLVIWDTKNKQPLIEIPVSVPQRAVDFTPDGSKVAVGLPGGVIDVYSLPDARRLATLSGVTLTDEPRQFSCLRFDPSGRQLAEASTNSHLVLIYDLNSTNSIALPLRSSGVMLSWHPDGNHLAVASEHRDIYLWDLRRTKGHKEIVQAHSFGIDDLTFNHTGDLLASVGEDMVLKLWTSATLRQVVTELKIDSKGQLRFQADDRNLALIGARGSQCWHIENGNEYRVFPAASVPDSAWTSFCFGGDGRILITGGDTAISLWDAGTGRELISIPLKLCRAAFVDPLRGDLFASTAYGFYHWRRIQDDPQSSSTWRFDAAECFNLPPALGASAFSGLGRAVTVVHERHVHVACLDNCLSALEVPIQGTFHSLAVNASATWLATWNGAEHKLSLWTLHPAVQTPSKEFPNAERFAFSPDGHWILVNGAKGYEFLELGTWRSRELAIEDARPANQNGPMALAQLENGPYTLLALAVAPATVKVFELEIGGTQRPIELLTLESPDRKLLTALCLSQDGRRLALGTTDQTIQVWDLDRLQKGLSKLGLEGPLQPFTARSESARSVNLASNAVDPDKPRCWEVVERMTADLPYAKPAEALDMHISRARAYLKLSQTNLAIQDYHAALELEPNNAQIDGWLKNLLPNQATDRP